MHVYKSIKIIVVINIYNVTIAVIRLCHTAFTLHIVVNYINYHMIAVLIINDGHRRTVRYSYASLRFLYQLSRVYFYYFVNHNHVNVVV